MGNSQKHGNTIKVKMADNQFITLALDPQWKVQELIQEIKKTGSIPDAREIDLWLGDNVLSDFDVNLKDLKAEFATNTLRVEGRNIMRYTTIIRLLDGTSSMIPYYGGWTTKRLKEEIKSRAKIAEDFELTFHGKILNDNDILKTLDIDSGTVKLITPYFVMVSSNKKFPLKKIKCDPNWFVRELKEQIVKELNIVSLKQLRYKTMDLKDNEQLKPEWNGRTLVVVKDPEVTLKIFENREVKMVLQPDWTMEKLTEEIKNIHSQFISRKTEIEVWLKDDLISKMNSRVVDVDLDGEVLVVDEKQWERLSVNVRLADGNDVIVKYLQRWTVKRLKAEIKKLGKIAGDIQLKNNDLYLRDDLILKSLNFRGVVLHVTESPWIIVKMPNNSKFFVSVHPTEELEHIKQRIKEVTGYEMNVELLYEGRLITKRSQLPKELAGHEVKIIGISKG